MSVASPSPANSDLALRNQTRALASRRLFPGRMKAFDGLGLDLVVGKSEGFRIWDLDGREFLDLDLSGIHNFGHRHPKLLAALENGLQHTDMGHPLFARTSQAVLADRLAKATGLDYAIIAPSGTEANDIAIRSARRTTGRRKIVSCRYGYHGAAGLSGAAGSPTAAASFLCDYPAEFLTVEPNDYDAIEMLVSGGDIAAVMLEPVTQAAGYPEAPGDFWTRLQAVCRAHGTLIILDEIVTGLCKTGRYWGFQHFDVQPDILVVGKALSGGLYPVTACILSDKAGAWLEDDLFGYGGSFAGSELGCIVANAVLDLCEDPATLSNVDEMAVYFAEGLKTIASRDTQLESFTQLGLLYALHLKDDESMFPAMARLFKNGVLSIVAAYSPRSASVLIRPGLFVDKAYCDEALNRIEAALRHP